MAASIGLMLLIPLVYLVLAAVPPLCSPRAFGRGESDVFARSVLVAVPIGLVPAVEVAYFANDAAIIASLTIGSAIAAFVCTLLRKKRNNDSDIPRTSDPFDAGAFSPSLSPREEQFVRLLLKGKTPAEIAAFSLDDIFARLGLEAHLSPSWRNGLLSMIEKIRFYASHLQE